MPVPMVPAPRMPTVLMSRSLVSGADARQVGRLPLGEEGVLQRARHRGSRPPRGTAARSRAMPSASGSVVAASTASIAAFGAIGPLGWRAIEARALSNRPAGTTLSIFFSPMRRGGLPTCSLGEGDGRRHHVAVGDLVDQARGRALGRVDEGARGDQLQRLLDADGARQPLRAAGTRNDAELDLGQAELAHVLGRDAVVAAERQLQPAAQRRAVDRRHHRLGATARCGRSAAAGPAPSSPSVNSVMSAPAEKNLPVPVSTMALMPASALAALKAFSSPTRSACPSAFTGGLFMRMTATSPCFSVSTIATVRSPSTRLATGSDRPRLGAGLGQGYSAGTKHSREDAPCCAG